MAQAIKGDKVRVHYTGTLDDGSIFDSSEPRDEGHDSECGDECAGHGNECGDHDCGCGHSGPMEFVIGAGMLLARFEEAVIGLEPGQSAKVRIEADDAYGRRSDKLVAVFQRSDLPEGITPRRGDRMEVVLDSGGSMPVMISEVSDSSVTLDANHPLAGMDLTFDIRLLEILPS